MIKTVIKEIAFYMVVVLLIGGSFYFARLNHLDFEKAMVQQAEAYLLATARSQAQSIEKYIGDIRHELEILSASPVLQKSLVAADGNKGGIEAEYYYLLQDAYSDVEKLVDSIYLIDSRGTVLNVSPYKPDITGQDASRLPDVRIVLAEHQPYTSGVFENISGEKAIANLYPIFGEKKFAGILRATILVNRINNLITHINQEGSRRTLIIDERGALIGYPDNGYIGKDITAILGDPFFGYSMDQVNLLAGKMQGEEEGTDNIGNTLIAYCPIHIGNGSWSIAVAMEQKLIAGPINKNIRDNLLFMGFMFLVLFCVGIIFYRTQKKKNELLVSTATLDIINKQLHLEIRERKEIQQELQEYLHGRKKGQPPQPGPEGTK